MRIFGRRWSFECGQGSRGLEGYARSGAGLLSCLSTVGRRSTTHGVDAVRMVPARKPSSTSPQGATLSRSSTGSGTGSRTVSQRSPTVPGSLKLLDRLDSRRRREARAKARASRNKLLWLKGNRNMKLMYKPCQQWLPKLTRNTSLRSRFQSDHARW